MPASRRNFLRALTHPSIQEALDGKAVNWMEMVGEEHLAGLAAR